MGGTMTSFSGEAFDKGLSMFAWDLYRRFTDGNENVFLSPYSLSAALLLANLGTKGGTEAEIRAALGLQTAKQNEIHPQYKLLQDKLNSKTSESTILAIANRMFARLGLEVLENYKSDSEKFYGSQPELMDFVRKPEESRQGINKWAENQTDKKITDLLPSGSITPLTLIVLVNAIYFKAAWLNAFDPSLTVTDDFHVSATNRIKVQMMNAKRDTKYLQHDRLRCSGIELEYRSGSIVMVVILPDEIDGLKLLEEKLTSASLQKFCGDLNRADKPEVIISLPKFKMEVSFDMTTALPELGIKALFEPKTADLSGMLRNASEAYVSKVIHKAFIDVDEFGTEAAVLTAAVCAELGYFPEPPKPKRFIADHPFLFLIRDTDTGTILFLGRVVTPQ